MRRTPFAPLALALMFGGAAAEAQTLKIGYINSQEILASSTAAQQAEAQFQQDVQSYQAEITQLEAQLTRMQQNLQQQQLTLSPEARANREQEIRMRAQEYQQRVQQLDQQATERRNELIQPVMDRITAIIERVREEGNYALILDVAAGSIIAADESLDLTQTIIDRMSAAGTTPEDGD